jgi:Zn-dependent protease/predicted transcriptional regulator
MRGFRLGSILGFEIRIDYSWFIIFFLILWTFGFGVFPAVHPGQQPAIYMAMAAVGTLLFFASLVAHELAHSLVARRKGVHVSGITLFIFGGMAHATMEFEEPADEFQIAGVGPLSSLAIAGVFYLIGWVGREAGWSVAVVGVASYLAFINVALALFNLLPGFPLDGGRLFRAVAWKYTGDLRKATRWATSGGKVLGYLLIALGLVNFFAGNLIGGLWLVFIGWFMRSAAEASYLQLLLRRSLEGVRVADTMTPDPYTVPAGISVEEFVDAHVFRGRHQAYPVLDEGRPVGIITLERVKQVPREEWPQRTVGQAMAPTDERAVVRPDETMDRVLDRLSESDTGRVLVARDGSLVGIITRADVARWLERVQLQESR